MAKTNKLILLSKPLTTEQVRNKSKNGKKHITVLIAVSTDEMIDNDLEGFLDIISQRVHESGLLEDFSYKPVGMATNMDVVFSVTGSVSAILEN